MGLFGRKPVVDHRLEQLVRDGHGAEIRYLELLRREIARMLIEDDPDLLIRTFEKGMEYEGEVGISDSRMLADEASLVAKFRRFPDFDPFGLRHYIPYRPSRLRTDDLAERYLEIGKMLIFMRRRSDYPPKTPLFDVDDFHWLMRMVDEVKDDKACKRLKHAEALWFAFRSGYETEGRSAFMKYDLVYRDFEIEIYPLPSRGNDIEWGVFFKKTGEFGGFSRGDGMESYFMSDAAFENRRYVSERRP